MNEVIAEFINYLTQTKNYSAHTAIAYETDIRDFIKFYENFISADVFVKDLSKVDTIAFRSWLADRQKRDLSHKSTARALSSVRGFYKFLARNYGIKNDAIGLISSPKVPRKLSKAIEVSDVEHMHDAIKEIDATEPWIAARDWALVLLIFGCGLRISEALSLKNIDIVNRPDSLRILGKGSKERIVFFKACREKLFNLYIKDTRPRLLNGLDSDYLLVSKTGKLTTRSVEEIVKKYALNKNIKSKITPHTLRHTFATDLLNEGADIRSVGEMLGHESLSTTQIYTHVTIDKLKEVYDKTHPRSHN